MKRLNLILVLVIMIMTALTGCNFQNDGQSAEEIYQTSLENFLDQDRYYFDGSAQLRSDSLLERNMVVFNGRVADRRNVWMNLQLSFPDQGSVDEMQVASRGEQLYTRFSRDQEWNRVDGNDRVWNDEFNNWNPVFHFNRMQSLKQQVETVRDPNPDDDLVLIRVVLDPDLLKKQAVTELKNQSAGEINQLELKRLGQKLQIDDRQQLKEFSQSLQKQSRETEQMIADMANTLKTEGEYILAIDTTSYLPKKMELHLDTRYVLEGEQVHENMRVEMYLRDYNANVDMPDILQPGNRSE
ncbi:MAG: hypothetical protein H0Z33_01765 [Bacillaceae bacterium]|nr:hypothetical protein [Bacillaceae bacterium]